MYQLPTPFPNRQITYSPYVLKLSLLLLASGCSVSTMRRMWMLSSHSTMSTSTLYAHQHVVWHFVHEAFEEEMAAQRRRIDGVAALYSDGRRRLVLSAESDGAWAHTGHVSKQFTYVVQDVSRDWHTLTHETPQQREERLKRRRPRPPVIFLSVIDKARKVAAYERRRAGVDEKEEVKEGEAAQGGPAPRPGVGVKAYSKQGNWASDGGSAGMEGQGFNDMMTFLGDGGLLPRLSTLVVDQDLTVAATMREKHPNVKVAADPGHVRKSLRKSFQKVFTTRKSFRYMAYRQVAWMMRTVTI